MAGLLHDLRHAVRQLRARPGFTLAVLVILAAGIGANTAAFSLVDGLLLRPLPWPESESIVVVGQTPAERPGRPLLSFAALRRLRDDARSFEHVAAYAPLSVVRDGPDGPADLVGAAVTPSLFPLLRAAPRVGRLFTEAEAVAGADRVVLLSHRAWTGRFGSDPDVVGAPVVLDGDPHVVLGVLPAGFDFPGPRMDLWKPLVVPPDEPPRTAAWSSWACSRESDVCAPACRRRRRRSRRARSWSGRRAPARPGRAARSSRRG